MRALCRFHRTRTSSPERLGTPAASMLKRFQRDLSALFQSTDSGQKCRLWGNLQVLDTRGARSERLA